MEKSLQYNTYNNKTQKYDSFGTTVYSANFEIENKDLINALNYLPDFLKDSQLMLSIMDALNVLISEERPVFAEIFGAHNDMIYKTKDYSKVSYEGKIEIVHELGFGYLLDILTLSSEQLTQLLIFFNLIYILKGKREGLDICLKTLGMNYKYITWDELDPHGAPFTADLNIIGNDYAESQVFAKIRTFIRSYMLPWVNITVELTLDGPILYIYPSYGISTGIRVAEIFEATRDVVGIALYDHEPAYDIQYYGANIYQAPDQDNPYVFPNSKLTIRCIPETAKVTLNGEEAKVKEFEQGKIINFKVEAKGYKSYQNHVVLTGDKTINVTLEKF